MIEKIKGAKFIISVFLIAFIIRLAAALVIHYGLSPELQDKIVPPDAREYIISLEMVRAWKNKTFFDPPEWYRPSQFHPYIYYVSAIIYVTGYNRVSVPIVNSFLGALAVFFIYGLAKRIFNKRSAYISCLFYAFFPSLIFWSSQNLKDGPALFIIIVSMWLAVELLQEPFRLSHLGMIVIILPMLWALNVLRSYIYIFLIYSIVLFFIVNLSRLNYKKNIVYALFFFIFICIIPPQHTKGWILADIPFSVRNIIRNIFINKSFIFTKDKLVQIPKELRADIDRDLGAITYMHRSAATGNAAFYSDVDLSSPIKALKFLPKGMAYFLFAPFPWKAEGLLQKATIPESILWYIIFLFILYGMYIYLSKWRVSFALIFFICVLSVAYALVEGNFGTAYRHKATLLPFFFIFAGAGISRFTEGIRRRA